MKLNFETMKAHNQEPEACWECYNCIKICPQQAMEVRGYADFMPLGASVIPLKSTDSIMWTIKFRNGKIKRFKFPTRTKEEGSVVPYAGEPEVTLKELKNCKLHTEYEKGKELPTPAI
jgi:adenylylsulfate reductase subunit B